MAPKFLAMRIVFLMSQSLRVRPLCHAALRQTKGRNKKDYSWLYGDGRTAKKE